MRRRAIDAARQTLEHVADVAEKRFRDRRRIDPPRSRLHLEPPGIVLSEYREQAVVGVSANAPGSLAVSRRARVRIVEDAKQDERVAIVPLLEVAFVQGKAERDPRHQRMTERGQGVDVAQYGLAKTDNPWKEIRA